MSVPRQSRRDFPAHVQITASRTADAVRDACELTARDHCVIALLAQHRAMRADHLARLAFPNIHRARHRLLILTNRGILARARQRVLRHGEPPWIYTLGTVGATIHAARTDTPMPRPADAVERAFRILYSATLAHDLGVLDVFARLVDHTRQHPATRLDEWLPAHLVAETCGGILRPDAGGTWTDHTHRPARVRFFLEYDTDTESHTVLMRKIDAYTELADTGLTRPVLFVFSGATREQHFHDHLIRRYHGGPPPIPIATTDRGRAWSHPNPDTERPPHRPHRPASDPGGGPDSGPDSGAGVVGTAGTGGGGCGSCGPADRVWRVPARSGGRSALADVGALR